MSRRSKRFPTHLVIVIFALIAIAAAGFFAFPLFGEPFRTLPPLPISDYVQNSAVLEGNKFRLLGVVDDQILWKKGKGRLMSIRSENSPVAVLFPDGLRPDNLAKGQRIAASVEVGEHGILTVTAFQKQ